MAQTEELGQSSSPGSVRAHTCPAPKRFHFPLVKEARKKVAVTTSLKEPNSLISAKQDSVTLLCVTVIVASLVEKNDLFIMVHIGIHKHIMRYRTSHTYQKKHPGEKLIYT